MPVLQFDDYVMLSRADLEAKKIDYSNRMVAVDPESVIRIAKAGMADEKGNLTEKGVETAQQLKDRVKLLRRGVPFEQRKKSNAFKITESEGPWLSGTLKKRQYISDGSLFLFDSKPYASLKVEQGGPEFRMGIPRMVKTVLAKTDIVEVIPTIWQVQTLGGLEIIWMVDRNKSTVVPIQAMYYDYILKKYPSSRFYAIADEPDEPVQVRVKGAANVPDKRVVGIVATLELKEATVKPIMEAINGGEES